MSWGFEINGWVWENAQAYEIGEGVCQPKIDVWIEHAPDVSARRQPLNGIRRSELSRFQCHTAAPFLTCSHLFKTTRPDVLKARPGTAGGVRGL